MFICLVTLLLWALCGGDHPATSHDLGIVAFVLFLGIWGAIDNGGNPFASRFERKEKPKDRKPPVLKADQ
jgi:hypothetical protein